jgi:hypothetical protein
MFNKSFALERRDLISIVIHPGWVKTEMGGSNAPTSVQDSVAGMLSVIKKTTATDSGRFYDFEGDELPW